MELHEVPATTLSPYRCYVRGNTLQTEGENVYTLGFKDNIAVVQATTDMQKFTDIIDKGIDLTKLKKIVVKIDPITGKKYILKDGKKIEIVPQSNPILSLKKPDDVGPPSLHLLPRLVPHGSLLQGKMRVLDNVKYHVVSMNVKKPSGGRVATTMTDYQSVGSDKSMQTDSLGTEVGTQTDPFFGDVGISTNELINFIIDGDSDPYMDNYPPRKMIDPRKLSTKEEIYKFNFFNDMRTATNFDLAGNLPIHDSVIKNNLKAAQKCCVVLKAIQENVNILNQHLYAPLHLAVLHNASLEIVKVLLNSGADLRVTDPEGNTALHLAIENKRSGILRILIRHATETKFNLDVFNHEGFTPLILACLNSSYEDAKLLLESGANPNVKDMKSGRTALFHAAEGHQVFLVELLMNFRADTKIRNFFGTSPHDAMFELDDVPIKIKFAILGRDHQRFQAKKKLEAKVVPPLKKAKLVTTPVLKKVSTSDLMGRKRK